MTTDALKKLHTAMLDTRQGYEVAERDAETPALKTLFAQMIALRTKDHEAIHHALREKGVQVDDKGSFMASIHKAATSVRSAVTGLDADALSPFIKGEESIVDEYDPAIEEAATDDTTRDMLTDQQTALLGKIAEMKAMQPG